MEDDVPPHAVITGADLYIENLNKSFNGTYRCSAANAVGESFDDYVLYVYGRSVHARACLCTCPPNSRSLRLLSVNALSSSLSWRRLP